jgi:hypothetical protein
MNLNNHRPMPAFASMRLHGLTDRSVEKFFAGCNLNGFTFAVSHLRGALLGRAE